MSNVFFIGDTHFGHTGIERFRKEFPNEQTHSDYIASNWTERVRQKDIVYVLGDCAFTLAGLRRFGSLPGRKILIRGNHDILPTEDYLKYFEEIHGAIVYKKYWLTHIPIHGQELYGRSNIHGHCHRGGPDDIHRHLGKNGTERVKSTYFNTCCEFINYTPISLQEINEAVNERLRKG